MNTQKQIGLMVALMFLLTAGCAAYTVVDLPIRAGDQAKWHFEESVHRGALLYANNCRTCHGIRGEGFVGPPLNTPDFKNQDPLVLAQNRHLLERTIVCGRAGTRMPAWLNTLGGSLNERQIEHLINLITAPPKAYEGETNKGWAEAVHVAHNLNHETALVVGGDTLLSIARQHDIGIAEVLALNPALRDPFAFLPKGTIVRLPASSQLPLRDHEVASTRETVARIVDSQFVGAMIIADLNQIPYQVNPRRGEFIIGGREGVAEAGVGLYPGAQLSLPLGAGYVLRAGDTIESVAALHNVLARDIVNLNRERLSTNDITAELDVAAKLRLPAAPVYIVQPGDTAVLIETKHGLPKDSLEGADLTPGARISLPGGTGYVIQARDTLASVAASHAISEAELATLNELAPGTPIRPEVVLALPEGARYVVQGQSLEDIRLTLGGVTANSLAQAQEPPVTADHVYAVGTNLIVPPDAYGPAPPDTINPGTACVQYAVTASAFESIFGGGGPPAAPAEFSEQVEILSHANDWTVVADGSEQPANKGVVKVPVGTTITFRNVIGLHTITVDGVTEVPMFSGTDTHDRTFSAAGTFKITCDFHPDMLAWVYVEEPQ